MVSLHTVKQMLDSKTSHDLTYSKLPITCYFSTTKKQWINFQQTGKEVGIKCWASDWLWQYVRIHTAVRTRAIHLQQTEKQNSNEKRSDRCKHCVLAVVRQSQKFSLRRRPLPGGAGWPKFNQLVIIFTYKHSLLRIDAHNFELSW